MPNNGPSPMISQVFSRSYSLSGTALLKSRKFIRLDGLDAGKFLQGLTTNDVHKLHPQGPKQPTGQYSALLNAQGRLMYDIFLYHLPETSEYIIECDGQVQDRVFLHLQTYNLRTKTSIKMMSDSEGEGEKLVTAFSSVPIEGALAFTPDNRADWDFTRYLLRLKDFEAQNPAHSAAGLFSEARYNRERILKGIPEGSFEIQARQAIPLEFNVELMGGIDFSKGCYLGQELVHRTHHRGVVRKRIMPLKFYSQEKPHVEFDATSNLVENLDRQCDFLPATRAPLTDDLKILSKTDVVGRLIVAQGNIGLGLMRLDALAPKPELMRNMAVLDPILHEWVLADTEVPSWWPAGLLNGFQQ